VRVCLELARVGGIPPPSHAAGHVSGPRTIAIRLCTSARSSLGVVVTMAKLRTHSHAGERHVSQALSRQLVAGFLVVSFEPFESCDHDFAGRERFPVLAWDSERR
jgi:hypothetical protein